MNLIEEVRPEVSFYLANGATIKTISELILQLRKTDDKVYSHHVNSARNDFANWIKDIYQDEALANNLKKAKSKKYLIRELENALKETNKRLAEEKKKAEKAEKKRQEEHKRGVKIIESPKKKSEILKLLGI